MKTAGLSLGSVSVLRDENWPIRNRNIPCSTANPHRDTKPEGDSSPLHIPIMPHTALKLSSEETWLPHDPLQPVPMLVGTAHGVL